MSRYLPPRAQTVAEPEPYPTRDKAVREPTKARREAAAKLGDLKPEAKLVARVRERDAVAAANAAR